MIQNGSKKEAEGWCHMGHCKKNEGNQMWFECNHSEHKYWGGILQFKNHLAGCILFKGSMGCENQFIQILHDMRKDDGSLQIILTNRIILEW